MIDRFDWTEARIEHLKELHKAGASYIVIGQKLGGLTRSAISGKVRRLGLSEPIEQVRERQKAAPKKRRKRDRTMKVKPPLADLFALPPPIDPNERSEFACTLFDLNEYTCRWPVGEPGTESFFFCGRDAQRDKPYCTAHCKVAFNAAAPRVYNEDERARRAGLTRYQFTFGGTRTILNMDSVQ